MKCKYENGEICMAINCHRPAWCMSDRGKQKIKCQNDMIADKKYKIEQQEYKDYKDTGLSPEEVVELKRQLEISNKALELACKTVNEFGCVREEYTVEEFKQQAEAELKGE